MVCLCAPFELRRGYRGLERQQWLVCGRRVQTRQLVPNVTILITVWTRAIYKYKHIWEMTIMSNIEELAVLIASGFWWLTGLSKVG